MPWTKFYDTKSGETQKEDFTVAYIEAPIEEAKVIFYNRFGHSPDRVSCSCCGADYEIEETETLEEATAFDREASYVNGEDGPIPGVPYSWMNYVTLPDYLAKTDALVVPAADIAAKDRKGKVPVQGWVWN